MQNYRPGDKICIFGKQIYQCFHVLCLIFVHLGFSRGAYTARALAGFLHKVLLALSCQSHFLTNDTQIGLLPKDNPEQVPIAYKLFKQTDVESIDLAAGFKQTFCRSVKIEFMGVW